jgi:hypothetical protein
MADSINPNGNGNGLSANLLPNFFKTDSNKKFLQATVDQLVQPGAVKKINGYVGRQYAKATKGTDIFVTAADSSRQNYQLEPGVVVKDQLDNINFFKDYIDYINQLSVFGANTANHSRLNKQEFYSWNPHIEWDKFVNFQNYYWLPYGPDTITIVGHQLEVNSSYTVLLENESSGSNQYLFTPDGLTRNPVLTLYRGQTYQFKITSPNNPFSIKLEPTLGTADRYIIPTINNYGVVAGTITFKIPQDAPDVLYYQSETDLSLGGVIHVLSSTSATYINVTDEVLGKSNYTLPDGTALSNGMKINFAGNVTPASYAKENFYVEGVGSAIVLVPESVLEVNFPFSTTKSVLFDTDGFDNLPFSDVSGYAGTLDYITINRASRDHNPWSRYNRWFHKDVITASANYNKNAVHLDQASRAVRPIIEFQANLKLFNLGTTATVDIDLIDTFTKDAFSIIEGSRGYNIDGIDLVEGMHVLFTADTDRLVKNNIYKVTYTNILGYNQIHLTKIQEPVEGYVVLVRQGVSNQSNMYWYDSDTGSWKLGQIKSSANQPPLFDVVDESKHSYGNTTQYPGSNFIGTKLFSYKVNTSSSADTTLGFALSYKNIANIGDIVFNFNLLSDTFQYKTTNDSQLTAEVKKGYLVVGDYVGTPSYSNGWKTNHTANVQAAVRVYKNSNKLNTFDIDIFDNVSNLKDLSVKVYVNGIRLNSSQWSLVNGIVYKKIVLTSDIKLTDILTIKAYASQAINNNGHYEIPLSLQNNPLNGDITEFTLGEVIDHVESIVENLTSFSGVYPGASNLRDLGDITQYGTKFIQHSGPASLSVYHITNQSNNIVRALEKARDDYNNFKKNFVITAEKLGLDSTASNQVDLVLSRLNQSKTPAMPYYFSDMLAYGASTSTKITVVDRRIKTYPLTKVFNLDSVSNNAVYVYINDSQLVYDSGYTFTDLGFILIDDRVLLANGDIITIVEYDTTDGSYIPETPTKLGIWPKYEPKIYLDTTLVTPRMMIQGHDGSLTLAYGDYRDNIILELEKRIFNNIKIKYNTEIFDIFDVIPGYNKTNEYSLDEFNTVLSPSFYKWTSLVNRDFTKQLSYNRNNPFTYNYSGHAAPDGTNVPGYWRGIYSWIYGTDRPNLCPWEMLGFAIEPAWWTRAYGPAPYTSENLVMWQDIAAGQIKQPGRAAVLAEKYVRPFLVKYIPVDQSGNLIDPMLAGVATGSINIATNNNFVFGDGSPVETAWRRSSHFPFSVLLASMLLTPAKTFGLVLDRSRIVRNLTGQLVYKDTNHRISPASIIFPSISTSTQRTYTAGIINYLVNYISSDNLKSYSGYQYDLKNISVNISYRIGAFSSKPKFNLLLDSKTPLSSGSVFIPQEDYSLVLNSSSPVKKITYSGIIITKLTDGYEIKGYSPTQTYFKYYNWAQTGPLINIGGISESFVLWTAGQQYTTGQVVKLASGYFRAVTTHTATATFNPSYFQSLSSLPVIGGKNAYFRKSWDRSDAMVLPYGTKIADIQSVVDFILGYGEWLKDQGFIFDDYNIAMETVSNWETSAKEFMFWTTQNWSTGQDKWSDWIPNNPVAFNSIVKYNGDYYRAIRNVSESNIFDTRNFELLDGLSTVGSSVISLSPSALKLSFNTDMTVVDDVTNPFNGYEIFKVDGTPLSADFIQSFRSDNAVSYSPKSNDGIYCATFYLVQKEQIIIINNQTMFNDTIYHPESGYKQDRIKIAAYISDNWHGGFDIPGFLFDEAVVSSWEQYTKYYPGDIVKQGQYYLQADPVGNVVQGTATLDTAQWMLLPRKPQPKLLPNWNYKANQFTDFYSLDSDNFDSAQQEVAQHLIGYQKRQYLDNIIKDNVSEYKFYQGMIRDKGTQNVLNKLFNVLSSDNLESLEFYEEWAVRVGQYGASSGFENIEFKLDQSQFKNNPQAFELVNQIDPTLIDFVIRQTPNSIYVKPLGYNSNPWPAATNYNPYLRSAGYVNSADVKVTIKNLSEIASYDITTFNEGDYVWVTFEGPSWNVYRFTDVNVRPLVNLDQSGIVYDSTAKLLTITTENIVPFTVGSYIGLTQVEGLNGFYQITSTNLNSFTVSANISNWPITPPANSTPNWQPAEVVVINSLISQRTDSIDNIDTALPPKLTPGQLLWTDDNGQGKWTSWIYNSIYTETDVKNSTPNNNLKYGNNVAVNKNGTIAVVAIGTGSNNIYKKYGKYWEVLQTLNPPFIANELYGADPNVFMYNAKIGAAIAISDDEKWLAIGSPNARYAATKISSHNNGIWSSTYSYSQFDIVTRPITVNSIASRQYYRALKSVTVGSTAPENDLFTWEPIPYLPTDATGVNTSYSAHGAVSLYSRDANGEYQFVDSILSPTFSSNENFGSSLAFGKDVLYVGTPGFNNNQGRVYTINYQITVHATSQYNSTGSAFGQLAVNSTAGVVAGMIVSGKGFTSGQAVEYVLTKLLFSASDNLSAIVPGMKLIGVNVLPNVFVVKTWYDIDPANPKSILNQYVIVKGPVDMLTSVRAIMFTDDTYTYPFTVTGVQSLNTVLLTGSPDSTPSGNITFETVGWQYNYAETYQGVSNSKLGYSIALSSDGNVLAITSVISGNGTVKIYNKSVTASIPVITSLDLSTPYPNFGQSVTISNTGKYIVVSNDAASTLGLLHKGDVTIYEYNSSLGQYTINSLLVNRQPQVNGQFGNKIAFMNDFETLAVFSLHGDTQVYTTFSDGTTFDKKSTTFVSTRYATGRVDIYDRYATKWVFSQSLSIDNREADGYGTGFAVGNNTIFVSAPNALDQGLLSGKVYNYNKPAKQLSWNVKSQEVSKPDPYKIKTAFLYNTKTEELLTYLDVVDPLQAKIPGIAAEELSYQSMFDPAVYSVGISTVTVDSTQAWNEQQVGKLWWDLRSAKFIEPYDNSVVDRNGLWNTLAHGASIDIYEWVSSTMLPAVWDTQADTEAGLAVGVSGKTLYGNSVYSMSQRYDTISQSFRNTYYFWVINKKITPSVSNRHLSAQEVSNLISNPRGQGYRYLALTGTNSFSLVNIKPLLANADVALSVEYWTIEKTDQNIHSQWKLLNDSTNTSIPSNIEEKWIDSLCGKDTAGRIVPDINLPQKIKYGIENRPRQGMFINRIEALKQFIEGVNQLCITEQIAKTKDISMLELFDPYPSALRGEWDESVDQIEGLQYSNISGFKQAIVTPVITDGRITDINVVTPGQGYRHAPYIEVVGAGINAVVKTTIDGTTGSITGYSIIAAGEGYTDNTVTLIRSYSVLVKTDTSAQNNWSIYSYDTTGKLWSRVKTKTYDVTQYWLPTDWYGSYTNPITGITTIFNQYTVADVMVDTIADVKSVDLKVGQLVKVKTAGTGGWELFYKFANSNSIDYTQSFVVVGIQNGTIQFNSDLYDFKGTPVGYDASTYDGSVFDVVASTELRIILNALKKHILTGSLAPKYMDLFFASVRYIMSEQLYVDWIFKTSFVKARHNVGQLTQSVTYTPDNLSNFEDYVNEVKPYRTLVREYVSAYENVDTSKLALTDFDLPSVYENQKVDTVSSLVINGAIATSNPIVQQYPWKFWLDNASYNVDYLHLINPGSGYIGEPKVTIVSDTGTGATARALVSSGVVSQLILLTKGSGYLSAPTVIIDGGLSTSGVPATAIASISNSLVRTNKIQMKFDRITNSYVQSTLTVLEQFQATGQYQFALRWAPDVTIGKSTVTIIPPNGVEIPVLSELYTLNIAVSTTLGYSSYSGLLEFVSTPAVGSVIKITYNKDISILNAADRIQFYYDPQSGNLGKELSQLMIGIDYGGTIVDGLGFSLSKGWDSQPWYSDKWDNFDQLFDDYIIEVAANTHTFTLPYTPANNTNINLYYVKNNVETHSADGSTTSFAFNAKNIKPVVTATVDVITTGHIVKLTGSGSFDNIIILENTTGIVVGMGIIGIGFNSTHIVTKIINSTTISINNPPGLSIGASLDFVSNGAGSNILHVTSTSALQVGDLLSIATAGGFNLGTKIQTILSSTTVQLNQIVIANVPDHSTVTFVRSFKSPVDVQIFNNGIIQLTQTPPAGTTVSISGPFAPIKLDDINFGSQNIANKTAIMQTPIFGVTAAPTIVGNSITIPSSFTVSDGDTFILRKSTSDGSITPQTDYDSVITGGDLAYSSATGLAADDIILDGDGFVTPTSSPAPEEVVPGQIVDTLAIKVFDRPSSGSGQVRIDSYTADGLTASYKISQIPNSNNGLIVKVGSQIKSSATDYTIDYKNQLVILSVAPSVGSLVSIFSIGFNGYNILDLDYFIGDGVTTEFLTKAPWEDQTTSLVYVNGQIVSPALFKTDLTYQTANRVGLRFGTAPAVGDLVNYIIVLGTQQTFAITKTEKITGNGGTTYPLANIIGNLLPIESNMLVRVDQQILPGPQNIYFKIGSNRLNYPIDPVKFAPNSLLSSEIKVYAGSKLLSQGTDYIIDLTGITVKINKTTYKLHSGQQLIISVIKNSGYVYTSSTPLPIVNAIGTTGSGPFLVSFRIPAQQTAPILNVNYKVNGNSNPAFNGTFASVASTTNTITLSYPSDPGAYSISNPTIINPLVGYITFDQAYDSSHIIEVTSSYNHNVLDIQRTAIDVTFSQSLVPNTIQYYYYKGISSGQLPLDRLVIDDNYVWVTKNNTLLIPTTDYKVNDDRMSLTLATTPTLNDNFVITTFGSNVLSTSIAYMQFKDMLNRVHYKRLSKNKQTILQEDLNYNDLTITVKDPGNFDKPNLSQKKPGVIEIRGERIEYYRIDGNVLSQLRRGTLGTGIAKKYLSGTVVQDIGPSETIPYVDNQDITKLISTGNTTINLQYIPRSVNEIEVFVGNIRLKKHSFIVHSPEVAPDSPAGDVTYPAEFSVDGIRKAITLASIPTIGQQIIVVRTTLTNWDSGLNTTNTISNFLKATPGIWYAESKPAAPGPSSITRFDNTLGTLDENNITFDRGN